MVDIQKNSKMLKMTYKKFGVMEIQCTYPRYSKSIIDEIDQTLAQHFAFHDDALDFIVNFDIKYRLGADDGEDKE